MKNINSSYANFLFRVDNFSVNIPLPTFYKDLVKISFLSNFDESLNNKYRRILKWNERLWDKLIEIYHLFLKIPKGSKNNDLLSKFKKITRSYLDSFEDLKNFILNTNQSLLFDSSVTLEFPTQKEPKNKESKEKQKQARKDFDKRLTNQRRNCARKNKMIQQSFELNGWNDVYDVYSEIDNALLIQNT